MLRLVPILVAMLVGCGARGAQCPDTAHARSDTAHARSAIDVRPGPSSNVERFASVWDAPERDTWQRPAESMVLLGAEPGQTVVDLGTGTGYFLPFLSVAVGPRGHVLALDTDAAMIAHVRGRAEAEGLANVEARLVSTSDPGLAPESVDHVLVVDTWHDIVDRAAYASRLREALRPGGTVLVIDFTMDATHGPPVSERLSEETVALDLTNAGFDVEVTVEGLLEQYAVRGTRP